MYLNMSLRVLNINYHISISLHTHQYSEYVYIITKPQSCYNSNPYACKISRKNKLVSRMLPYECVCSYTAPMPGSTEVDKVRH